jgi:2-keto-4-pentenoate hydratase/2-oxohepta-3-ene-1,7-dioic acid hydratase in catechol pathway
MKLLAYLCQGRPGWGTLVESPEGNVRVTDGIAATGARYRSLDEVLAASALPEVCALLSDNSYKAATLPLADVTLQLPLHPGKLLAVGGNYGAHAQEIGMRALQAPVFFSRFADSLVGPDAPLIKPRLSQQLDFEGELAVVIGRAGRHIRESDALSHVAGYTCFNDGSVRDFQKESITAGKNFFATGPLGPWIVTAKEFADPSRAILTTRLNGREMQHAPVSDLIHPVAALIAYASSFTPLAPGDVIATGTPAGIGSRRSPPVWLQAGDRIEVEISGIGVLRNTVVDEATFQ